MQLGLPEVRAHTRAEILLEAELMGHSAHGLHLLPSFLSELETAGMCCEGEPIVLGDRPGLSHWDGRFPPGIWLVTQAIEAAATRLAETPVMAVVIRRAHHVAALVAYPGGLRPSASWCC